MTDQIKDEAWIKEATLQELMDAIRQEPPDSPLFSMELAPLFWDTYKTKFAEVYRVRRAGG